MGVTRIQSVRTALVVAAVVSIAGLGVHAQSGTVLSQTVTSLKASNPSMDFEIAGGKSAGTTTKIVIELGPDGNSASPPPDPSLPSSLRFRVTKTGVGTPAEFEQAGGTDTTTFANKVVVLTKGLENPGDPRGLYVLAIAHIQGTSAAETWKLEITNVPTGLRTIANIDQGVFTGASPTGVCSGESTPQPCPNVCKPGFSCQPLWVFPWWKYAQIVYLPKWPPIPDPCLSCPAPWKQPVPDGFDRIFVGVTPYLKENAPLGPGRARDIKMAIDGGEAVGPIFDVGNGTYMQLVQHRRGEAPRIRAAVGDVTTEEIVAGPTGAGGVDPLFRTLTFVLAGVLLIALIALARRRGAAARG